MKAILSTYLLILICTLLQAQDARQLPVPTEPPPTEEDADEVFRTSDHTRRGKKSQGSVPQPPKSERIGCICMDNTPSDATGRGACSGRGGVQFWVYPYALPDGTMGELYYPSERALNANPELQPQITGGEIPEVIVEPATPPLELPPPSQETETAELLKWLIVFALAALVCITIIVIVKHVV